SVRTPSCPSRGGRSAWRDDRERWRRVFQDRSDFPETITGTSELVAGHTSPASRVAMFSTSDTIVAIATPPGPGGLGVVRLSGPDAHRIARQLARRTSPFSPRHATLTRLWIDATPVDHVVATLFSRPNSYTGDDTVEFSAHGSSVVLRSIVSGVIDAGARLAEPGEFTLRAFLNGRIDLTQA